MAVRTRTASEKHARLWNESSKRARDHEFQGLKQNRLPYLPIREPILAKRGSYVRYSKARANSSQQAVFLFRNSNYII
jgi:hypothetical protein